MLDLLKYALPLSQHPRGVVVVEILQLFLEAALLSLDYQSKGPVLPLLVLPCHYAAQQEQALHLLLLPNCQFFELPRGRLFQPLYEFLQPLKALGKFLEELAFVLVEEAKEVLGSGFVGDELLQCLARESSTSLRLQTFMMCSRKPSHSSSTFSMLLNSCPLCSPKMAHFAQIRTMSSRHTTSIGFWCGRHISYSARLSSFLPPWDQPSWDLPRCCRSYCLPSYHCPSCDFFSLCLPYGPPSSLLLVSSTLREPRLWVSIWLSMSCSLQSAKSCSSLRWILVRSRLPSLKGDTRAFLVSMTLMSAMLRGSCARSLPSRQVATLSSGQVTLCLKSSSVIMVSRHRSQQVWPQVVSSLGRLLPVYSFPQTPQFSSDSIKFQYSLQPQLTHSNILIQQFQTSHSSSLITHCYQQPSQPSTFYHLRFSYLSMAIVIFIHGY